MNLKNTEFADRYAVYTRVSTDGQEDNTSPESQRDACVKYADQQNWAPLTPNYWFHDTVSGVKEGVDREMLGQLYNLIEEKKVKHIIFKRVDRVGRVGAVIKGIIQRIYELGGVVSIADKGRTYKTFRECSNDIKFEGVFAEWDRDNIYEKNLEGRVNQFKKGSALGKQAFGYITKQDPNQKTKFKIVVEQPEEAAALVDFLEHFAQSKNIKESIDYSIQKGYRVRSGGYFTHHFFRDTLKLLDKYNGKPVKEQYKFYEEVFEREMEYPKIISDDLYKKVIEAYQLKNKADRSKFEGIRPFGGLIYCTHCGEVATVRIKNIKRKGGYSTFIVGCSSYGKQVQQAYRHLGKNNHPDCNKTFRYTELTEALFEFIDNESKLGLAENYARQLSEVAVKLNRLKNGIEMFKMDRENNAAEKANIIKRINKLLDSDIDISEIVKENNDKVRQINDRIELINERIKQAKQEYDYLAELLNSAGLPIDEDFIAQLGRQQQKGVGDIMGMAFAAYAQGKDEFDIPEDNLIENVILPDVVQQLSEELAQGLGSLKGLVQAEEWAQVNTLLYRLGIRFYADFNTPAGQAVDISVGVTLNMSSSRTPPKATP